MTRSVTDKPHGTRGSSLIEFSVSGFVLMIVIFGVLELSRMVLVYTAVANSARAAARYAIVHGNDRTGTGVDGPSGPAGNPAQVVLVAKNFAAAGMLDITRLVIAVTYADASNAPGKHVSVKVVYPYDPFTSYLALTVRLGSISQGIIAF